MHLGIIMDGNGRWAVERRLPRAFGHKRGASKVTEIVTACPDLGIKTLTLYAFSTENWTRTAHEVSSLMKLFRGYLQNKFLELVENNVKVVFLGDPSPIARDISSQMKRLELATKDNDGLTLNIALNYGGRDEIVRAAQKFGMDTVADKVIPKDLTTETFERYLDTKGQTNPDLIIRTAGQRRISNFLLWQIAYSELYFTNTTWPDFTIKELQLILSEFNQEERTFGGNKSKTTQIH